MSHVFRPFHFPKQLMIDRRLLLQALTAQAGLCWFPVSYAAPAQAAPGAPVKGGHLISVVVPEPQNVGLAISNPSIVIVSNVFDGLVAYDENFKLVPRLAESWQSSSDGKTITFKLRRGVKWHDGKPFTSADVQYSLMEFCKKVLPRGAGTYGRLQRVETPDAHTAVLHLDAPSPVIWAALSVNETQILPRHIYEGSNPLTNPANNRPVGTGPFVFKEWVRGSHVTLERNPDYWEADRPHLDRLTFRVINDAAARAASLENGEVQYIPLSPVPLADVARLASSRKVKVERRGWEAVAPMYFFEFNLRRKPFEDIRVRQAIAHAIDRNALAKSVFYGFAEPATGPVPSSQKRFRNPGLAQYAFDPDRAEKLLDQAGLRRQADGVRLRLNHLTLPYGDDYKRAGEVFRQQLKRIGVEVTLLNYDLPTYLRKVYTDFDFDTQSLFLAAYADPQIGVQRRYWTQSIKPGTPWGNASSYSNLELDAILEQAQIEPDEEKRRVLLYRFQDIVQRDVPSVSLLELQQFRVWSSRLQGVDVGPFGVYSSLGNAWLAPEGT